MEADKPKGTRPCLEPEVFINDVVEEAVSPVLLIARLALVNAGLGRYQIGRYQIPACLADFSSFFIRRVQ